MNKLLRKYIFLTYGVFYGWIMLIGIVMIFLKAPYIAEVLKAISAWTPTLIFVVMFHKLYRKEKLADYTKKLFSERINWQVVLCIVLIQGIIFLGSILWTYKVHNEPIQEQLYLSWSTWLMLFFSNLVRGPLGEEIGWRGFMLKELQKSTNGLKAAVIVGMTWGFWHMPLWLLSGYEGILLIQYIISFLVSIISVSIIMTVFYNLNDNRIIPITIHQLFNLFINVQRGNQLNILKITAIFYLIFAVILILINYKKCLYKS